MHTDQHHSNPHSDQKRVPTWDGDHTKFEEFKERIKWFVSGLSWKEKETAGPRIAAVLTGDAWKALEEINDEGRELIQQAGGDQVLVDFLEETLLDLPIPEASKYMKEYLFTIKRKNSESMKAYAQRSRIAADKLERAFQKVEKKRQTDVHTLRPRITPPENDEVTSWSSARRGPPASEGAARSDAGSAAGEEAAEQPWDQGRGWRGWWSGGGGWGRPWKDQAANRRINVRAQKRASPSEKGIEALENLMGRFDLPEEDDDVAALKTIVLQARSGFLPGTMAGWLLLQRSGLTAQERASVLASAKNSLDLPDIEVALRDQWADAELRERDEHHKQPRTRKAFYGDYEGDGDEEEEPADPDDWDEREAKDAWWGDEEDDDDIDLDELSGDDLKDAEDALAAIREVHTAGKDQRRTMAQARAVVRDIKLSRGFHKGKGKKGQKGKKDRARPGGVIMTRGKGGPCFNCGGSHMKRDCPKVARSAERKDYPALGNFAFGFAAFAAMETREDDAEWALANLREETQGKMVIDCGASRSLGSVVALEDYQALNTARPEPRQVIVHPGESTRFKFGNGDIEKTVSRVDLGITANGKEGSVSVHALLTKDDKYVPILASMEFLRKSKAVIDFDSGVAKFRAISEKPVYLERIGSGHLVIDLTKDLLKQNDRAVSSAHAARLAPGAPSPEGSAE